MTRFLNLSYLEGMFLNLFIFCIVFDVWNFLEGWFRVLYIHILMTNKIDFISFIIFFYCIFSHIQDLYTMYIQHLL